MEVIQMKFMRYITKEKMLKINKIVLKKCNY